MFGFKRKEYIKISIEPDSEKVLSNQEGSRMGEGKLAIEIHVRPDKGMSMALSAMTDVAERFRRIHNAMPEPCDCAAIRFANVILRHSEEINREMQRIVMDQSIK